MFTAKVRAFMILRACFEAHKKMWALERGKRQQIVITIDHAG